MGLLCCSRCHGNYFSASLSTPYYLSQALGDRFGMVDLDFLVLILLLLLLIDFHWDDSIVDFFFPFFFSPVHSVCN